MSIKYEKKVEKISDCGTLFHIMELQGRKDRWKKKKSIQVADRLFQTLEKLAANGPTGLVELSSELGLHKSTVHRILNSLIYMGYARQDTETNKYSLTYKIL